MDQGNADGRLHLTRHAVHGVGADHQSLGPRAFQPPGRLDKDGCGLVPTPFGLHLHDRLEVHRPQDQRRGVRTAQTFARHAVEQAIIGGGALPAHAADEA